MKPNFSVRGGVDPVADPGIAMRDGVEEEMTGDSRDKGGGGTSGK